MFFLKKAVIAMLIISASFSALRAEDWATDAGSAYTKGSKTLSIGAAGYPFGVTAAYEYGFHQAISGSAFTGYLIEPFWTDWTYHSIPIFVRAAFHPFNLKVLEDKIPVRNKLDAYVGLATGVLVGYWTKADDNTIVSEPDGYSVFQLREYIGVKYYLNEKISLFAEDCGGFPYFNFGVSFKL